VPLQNDEIRLLILSPGSSDELLSLELVHADLRTAAYEALSYMWGAAEPTKMIEVNEKATDIRSNLWTALQYLRHDKVRRVLWVDALCIDQEIIEERSIQVLRIDNIYKIASNVIIWIGDSI
jgi:hypothetical protein